MDCRPCWFVQSVEDGSFLAPDGLGGAKSVQLLAEAVPFLNYRSAIQAAVDYFDGQASVIQSFQLAREE